MPYFEMPTESHIGAFASARHEQFRWLYASGMFLLRDERRFLVEPRSGLRHTHGGSSRSGTINLMVAIPMLVVSPFEGVI
ncbi:hypothetical protein, partial [Candidatus Amarobacter glycogenicus]|uniref:hypothetical protein n=1 Tax=Candidatus Amarobacter glycogenicus TaxID=3140699 RepID=UPI0031CCC784